MCTKSYLQNPTQAFITKKIFRGCQSLGPTRDTRLPITPHILRRLLNALVHTVPQYSLRILLCALFLLAFHAFFAIRRSCSKILAKVSSCSWTPQLAAAQIIMRKHKFPIGHIPAIYSKFPLFCTVNALFEYLIALNIQVVLSFRQLMRVQFHIQKSQLI